MEEKLLLDTNEENVRKRWEQDLRWVKDNTGEDNICDRPETTDLMDSSSWKFWNKHALEMILVRFVIRRRSSLRLALSLDLITTERDMRSHRVTAQTVSALSWRPTQVEFFLFRLVRVELHFCVATQLLEKFFFSTQKSIHFRDSGEAEVKREIFFHLALRCTYYYQSTKLKDIGFVTIWILLCSLQRASIASGASLARICRYPSQC